MNKETKLTECCGDKNMCKGHHCHNQGAATPIYGLGVIGALFYFLQHAGTFTAVMVGIGKAVFWPAILMFKLLSYLQM